MVQSFEKEFMEGNPHYAIMVEYMRKALNDREDVTLWCAAIDPILNEKKYIVPGLGDAGDLCYGTKEHLSDR